MNYKGFLKTFECFHLKDLLLNINASCIVESGKHNPIEHRMNCKVQFDETIAYQQIFVLVQFILTFMRNFEIFAI